MRKNFTLIILSLLVSFFLLEILFRIIYPQDLQRYWVEHENKTGLFVNKKNYTHYLHRFNYYSATYKFGEYRNRITRNISDNKKKILVLGESFTFGWLLKNETTFIDKLQKNFINYNFINAAVGAWGVSHYLTFTELYCDEIKPNKILIFLNSDDYYRSLRGNYYFNEKNKLSLKKTEITSLNAEMSYFDKKIPFYRFLKQNSHVFIFLRNYIYDLIYKPYRNPWDEISYFPQPPKGLKINKKETNYLIKLNKEIFLRLNNASKKCNAELILVNLGWANLEVMQENNPNYNFILQAKDFFKKNKILFLDNSPYMKNIYKKPDKYYIKNDFHPNELGSEEIYRASLKNLNTYLK